MVEVARHQVGRGDVDGVLAAALEAYTRECSRRRPTIETTRMFSEMPGSAGAQTADAAHVEVDLHAGLGGGVERADAAPVDERVHLHRDARGEDGEWAAIVRSICSIIPSRSC